MINPNKYIGITHQFGQSSWESCDCIGLVKLFYNTEGFKEPIDDNMPMDKEEYAKTPYRLLRYFLKNMDRVKDHNDLQYGDVVVFRVGGELHTAVYIGYGKVLAMAVPVVYGFTKSTIYKQNYWLSCFVSGFRSRKEGK